MKKLNQPASYFSPYFVYFFASVLIVSCQVAWSAETGANTAATANTANLPSVESFFKDPDVRQAVLSPGGHYVAILSVVDGSQVLVVRDTLDLTKFTLASAANDNKILSVFWINENRLGFSLKNNNQIYQIGNVDFYAVDRDGSDLKQLISGSWDHHQQNTGSYVTDKTLTADFGFFSATHDNSDDIIIVKYLFNNIDMYSQGSKLFRFNSRTRKLSELPVGNQPANVTRWVLDGADVPRIAQSHTAGQCVTSYRASNSEPWAEIQHGDCYTSNQFSPLFFDNFNTLFVSSSYKGYQALFQYDLKKMQLAAEPFLSVAGFDFVGTEQVDRVAGKLLGIHYESDAGSTVWLDSGFSNIQKKIDGVLTQTSNTIHCGSDCSNSPALLISAASDRQPVQYFIYTTGDGKIVGIGGARPQIKPAQMGLRDFYHYQARDGRSIPVYVTLPPGKATKPMPSIVLVHGGPNLRGASWEWESDAQFLASRGYVVIQPEFRGSEGFGFDHFQAGWKQWGQTMQDDLADAAQWAIQKGWADPKRVGIMGASYGGYATLMGLIKNPEIFRCGVEWAGVTDINMMFNLSESDATQDQRKYGMKTTIGDQKTDAVLFKENSPLNHADRLTQPLLIAHGAQDRRVPIAHATAFHDAVTSHNKNVEWIVYADEGHGWSHEENNVDFWKHVEVFLDKNLKTVE